MRTQSSEPPRHEGLRIPPRKEREIYRTLLAANRAAEKAAVANDADGLSCALAARHRVIEQLKTMESAQSPLSSPPRSDRSSPAGGAESPRVPERLVTAWIESEARAGEAIRRSVALLRTMIRGVDAGRQGLKGYRGSPAQLPRFADRKG